MRAYWILPNRAQKDDLFVSDGEKIVPFRRFSIPSSALRDFRTAYRAEMLENGARTHSRRFCCATVPAWNGDKQLFSVSTPAGLDSSGRVVHLGLLFLLEPTNVRSSNCPMPVCLKKTGHMRRVCLHRMAHEGGDPWAHKVCAS